MSFEIKIKPQKGVRSINDIKSLKTLEEVFGIRCTLFQRAWGDSKSTYLISNDINECTLTTDNIDSDEVLQYILSKYDNYLNRILEIHNILLDNNDNLTVEHSANSDYSNWLVSININDIVKSSDYIEDNTYFENFSNMDDYIDLIKYSNEEDWTASLKSLKAAIREASIAKRVMDYLLVSYNGLSIIDSCEHNEITVTLYNDNIVFNKAGKILDLENKLIVDNDAQTIENLMSFVKGYEKIAEGLYFVKSNQKNFSYKFYNIYEIDIDIVIEEKDNMLIAVIEPIMSPLSSIPRLIAMHGLKKFVADNNLDIPSSNWRIRFKNKKDL